MPIEVRREQVLDATLKLIKSGEHVIVSDNTYGGTARLFTKILANYNIEFDFVDTAEALNVEAAIKPNTKTNRIISIENRLPDFIAASLHTSSEPLSSLYQRQNFSQHSLSLVIGKICKSFSVSVTGKAFTKCHRCIFCAYS